jgi:hypothetical protein
MNPANLLLVLSVANAAMDTAKNANALLSKATSEGRDVTDAEVDALVASNDALSADLIKRLRATV